MVGRKKKAGRASKAGHLIYINLLQHAPRADVDGTGFGGNGLPRRVYLALFDLDAGRQVNVPNHLVRCSSSFPPVTFS